MNDDKFVIECKKYKFIRFKHISGFIAFNKSGQTIGFDDIGNEIDELETQLAQRDKALSEAVEIMELLNFIDNPKLNAIATKFLEKHKVLLNIP